MPTNPVTPDPSPGSLLGSVFEDRLGLDDEARVRLALLTQRYQEAVDFGFLGPRERERIRPRHLDDSLGLAVLYQPVPGTCWIDLGSGAGLPGLPIAAVFPETQFTLVDAQQRRVRWVRSVADDLGIRNVEVLHERIEDLGRGRYRASFDVAVARALAHAPVVLELSLPLLRRGGLLVAPRGALDTGELERLGAVSARLGGNAPRAAGNVTLSAGDPGVVLLVEKVARTPAAYPRRPGVPQRQPLA